ncbi:MAG: hypothetical protein A2Y58_05480 [Chloroflexi bacterium RBG_13_51_52]|nr:MAG: hypothetical protein A2Y58_05480 [Chloroflexi bacterium RBG_13_51_52]
MAKTKYGHLICTELMPNVPLPPYREWERDMIGDGPVDGYHRGMEHVVWTDENVVPGGFYSEIVWLWGQKMPNQRPRSRPTEAEIKEMIKKNPQMAQAAQGVPPHAHPFPELLSFFGLDLEHPEELNGEVEFWLEDEKYILTKSFVVYIPPNVTHCPLKVRMETGLFHYTIGPGAMYI